MSNKFIENLIEIEEETQTKMNEESEEQIENLLDVSDEEILESIKLGEKEEKKAGRKKTATSIQADTIVNDFLTTRSDEAWKNLQEFFWYGIKQFAYKFVGNNDDAYDMTIETFINAYSKIDSYDPNKAKFSTWLWTICRNNCLGFKKQKKYLNIVDNDLSDIYDSELIGESYNQNLSEFENGIFEGSSFTAKDFSEVTKTLYDVSISEMNSIPGIGGKILHMKLVDNMKIREIADQLSMNESTVKNYLYRGKENLKRILSINHKDLVDTYADMSDAIDMAQLFY